MGMATRDPDCISHPIPISWEGGHTPVCMQVAMPLSPGNPGGRGRVLCTGQAVPLHAGSPGGSSKEAVFKGHFGDTCRDPETKCTPSRDPETDALPLGIPTGGRHGPTHWGGRGGPTRGPKGSPMSPHPLWRLGARGTVALSCTCTSCTATTAIKQSFDGWPPNTPLGCPFSPHDQRPSSRPPHLGPSFPVYTFVNTLLCSGSKTRLRKVNTMVFSCPKNTSDR